VSAPRQRFLPALAALLVLSTGGGLVLLWTGHDAGGFIALVLLQGAIHGVLAAIVLRDGATRNVLIACLACAALMRLIVLVAPPSLSDDVYRYVWDGRVQASGVNPYRYVPADPALVGLRDDAIYPHINRKDYATTIYPPGAQALYWLVTRASETVTAMKLTMVGCEIAALALLAAMLGRAGLPRARILLYALHPLPVWEFAGSGHVDAAMIAAMALALWLHQRGGRASTGAALAIATAIKLLPVAIGPALWRRWDWRLPIAFGVALALAYAPYLDVGTRVLGFLPTYVQEEGLQSGAAFYPLWLLRLVLPVPTAVYLAAAVLILLGLAAWVALRGDASAAWRHALWLAATFLFLTSPHFPWYLAWLLALVCLAPFAPALYLASASVLLYLPAPFALTGSIVYGGFAVLVVIDRLFVAAPLQEKPDGVSLRR
jgi:hypothetical protein